MAPDTAPNGGQDRVTDSAAHRCWADITLRNSEHEFVRCGRGVDHEGAHVAMTGQDEFVEWTDERHA